MEERRTEDAEMVSLMAQALLSDLFDYFRMDSGINPIILFEHLCCVLAQRREETGTTIYNKADWNPVERYTSLMEHFYFMPLSRQVKLDSSTFLDRPELLRRLLETTDGVLGLVSDNDQDEQLVPLLFDFLETILQSRHSEVVNTPFATAREIVRLIYPQEGDLLLSEILDPAFGSGAFLTAISSSLKTESEETKMTAIYSKQTGNFRITLNRKEAEALGYTSTSYDTLLTALQMWPDADCFHIYGSKAQVAADLTTAMARA